MTSPAEDIRRTSGARANGGYVPALRFAWLTRFYDAVLAATIKEEHFKRLLVAQARLAPGLRVLDLGAARRRSRS